MNLYNSKFDNLKVDIHLRNKMSFIWTRITGIQIGNWFIGVIKGRNEATKDE